MSVWLGVPCMQKMTASQMCYNVSSAGRSLPFKGERA